MGKWYYASEKKQKGPYSLEEMREMVARGQVKTTDLVWTESMDNWKSPARVPELAGVLLEAGATSAEGGQVAQAVATLSAEEVASARPARPVGIPPQLLGYANPTAESGVALNARGLLSLRKAGFWARFVGISLLVGGIGLCGLVATAVVMMAGSRFFEMWAAMYIAVYLVPGLTMVIVGLSANRFAGRAKRAAGSRGTEDLAAAMAAQHGLWRLLGIVVITYLGLIGFAVLLSLGRFWW